MSMREFNDLIMKEYTNRLILGMQIQLHWNYALNNPIDKEEMRPAHNTWLKMQKALNLK